MKFVSMVGGVVGGVIGGVVGSMIEFGGGWMDDGTEKANVYRALYFMRKHHSSSTSDTL
jgi:hypothetical protein